MSSQSLRSEVGRGLAAVFFPLILVVTGLGLILMPEVVGADWPGWSSAMVLVVLLALPAAFVLAGVSAGSSKLARWAAVIAICACAARTVWSLYDAGERAVFAAIALTPLLVLLVLAVLWVGYSWPRAITVELAEVARINGWQISRELPRDLLRLPPAGSARAELPSGFRSDGRPLPQSSAGWLPGHPLPLPVGRNWVVRNVVRADAGLAFEVRWLEWHGVVCRRRRLAVFVGRQLERELPALEVRPGSGLTRSDLLLESAEFNRSFDVFAEDARYVTAMLQPRVMQALLDGRPIGLAVDRDALVAYQYGPLDAETLARGLATIGRLNELVPRHVYDQWGTRPAPAPATQLRFAGPGWSYSMGSWMLRLVALSTGLLGLTLATCLAGAAAEAHANGTAFTPSRSLGSLLIAVAVLAATATLCALTSKPNPTHP
ncbi:hypothetical protein Kfla_5006 [Kribbella flavida DSM 17836]|uniref:Uncharacterized protein n=1 Tax=Kribbella flavida (strain DSM 17836 / JCM 10339 / NBRC 14399) TaxID=479435 RepID=D2Q276_KRIFD|nr:hypothetical protein [Kribbella flavida]ADB34022.1 hypothetical protein Kfla_5006 [Kribbella flavida DSM 17836]